MHFRSLFPLISLFVLGTAAAACKKQDSASSHEGSSAATGSSGGTVTPEPVASAHGDHGSRHGGAVLMDERGHMELVFKDDGTVEVWLSDSLRKAVPASTASTLELTLTRPGQAAETLALARDSSDGAWTGKTKSVTDPGTKIHFAYNAAGKSAPYQIDVTSKQLREMQEASEPAGHDADDHSDHDHSGAPDTHQGDGHADHDQTMAPGAAPTSLKDAVVQLEASSAELAAIVKDGDLSKAHMAAERLAVLGEALPDLATKAKLGADDVKALTIAGKKLRVFFKDIDEAGDGGKRDAAQKAFARYQEPMATIKAKAALAK